ncbi:MAG: phosphoribosylglycinamide formyltransferase [Lachnospiraceae bacterium]|nr:phosphoribosylglycinamide formyltransferase [Lachnospiraceae bacterium]
MLNITVLVSGGGTNLQAIINAIEDGTISDAGIKLVISSRKDAYALKRAADAGIETKVISRKEFAEVSYYEEKMLEALKDAKTDLIVLAGFMTVLPVSIINAYENRIINIHPSLIPSFCGKGYYGLKVHEEALKRGVKLTGATVHFVDSGCDTGPIILQKAVETRPDDTPEILQKRVMEQAEWKILPKAIDLIAKGRVQVIDNKTVIGGE